MKWLELKIPPPVVACLFGLLVYVVDIEELKLPIFAPTLLASTAAVFGFCFDFAGLWEFWRLRTTISPLSPQKASALVTHGVYKITRNPMYVGLVFFLIAWGMFLQSPIGLLMPIVFVGYINRFQIEPEERILALKFGDNYKTYCKRVGRWLW